MNSLYTLGVRQTSSIQADLERMKSGEYSAALSGAYPHKKLLLLLVLLALLSFLLLCSSLALEV